MALAVLQRERGAQGRCPPPEGKQKKGMMEWTKNQDALYRRFQFNDFREAFEFMKEVAQIAEKHQHHPRWTNQWNQVEIWLNTHDAGHQVTDKDHALAQEIDQVWNRASGKDDSSTPV